MTKLTLAAVTAALSTMTTPALAADLTVAELHAAAKVATDTFKNDYGVQFHDSIYGIQTTKRTDGGRIKLYYKANNVAQSIEYFCHFHQEEAMDCHEL